MNAADEIQNLKHQIQELQAELLAVKTQANRVKDASPVERPSLKRVMALVGNACMNLKKLASGWLISMGKLQRKFKSLKEIWLLLTQENWYLSDIFPPEKSNPQFKDAPPRLPKRYPIITQIFDWQNYRPPDKPDEASDCIANNPFVEDDMPFAWSN